MHCRPGIVLRQPELPLHGTACYVRVPFFDDSQASAKGLCTVPLIRVVGFNTAVGRPSNMVQKGMYSVSGLWLKPVC